MTLSEAKQRISALRTEVATHDERYYRQARPEISDREYDGLKRELAQLESKFPEAARAAGSDSPTERVGDDRAEGFAVVRHRVAMQSLDNTYSEAELREFHARLVRLLGRDDLTYVVEPKIDGLAVSLTYEKGKLVRAVTRGNGVEGDDVTANTLTIRALPRELKRSAHAPVPDLIEIRGEIYMTFAEFERINAAREEEGEERYANPRSLAAGTIKLLDPREVAERRLEVVLYGVGACDPAKAGGETQAGYHERVRAWGLPGVEKFWTARGIDEVWEAVGELDRLRRKFAYAHRRGGGEARLPGPAAGGGEHKQGPALGDGLQVRGRAGGDQAPGDLRAGWAHGRPDARRRA